jgi:cell division protein FtsZ
MVFEFDDSMARNAKMKVVGVGGAGGNAINRMIAEQLEGVEFIAINTDIQSLKRCESHLTIQIGKKLTRGLGAGARPEIGRQAVAESEDEVRRALEGADLVFVTAGMGGGTGTGAAPTVGRIAREMGALAIAIVTRPFHFEGRKRMRHAEIGLRELRRTVDTMIVVPNERLLSVVGKGTTFRDALKKADEVLLHATQGISDLISVTGEVNVDFADVRTVMSNRGDALMGTGKGTGENRAVEAAQQAICSPLLDSVSINGATGVLVNISGGPDLTIDEVTTINSIVQEAAGEEAEMIFGAVQDGGLEGQVRVTVIATGFGTVVEDEEEDRREAPRAPSAPVREHAPARERSPIPAFVGPKLVKDEGDGGEPSPEREKAPERREEVERPRPTRREDLEDLEIPTFIRRQMD